MGLIGIKTYANVNCDLTEDCTTTDAGGTKVKVSTADASLLNSWVQHFDSNSCRLLVGNFATYDSQYYAFEYALVSSIDTGTGIITFTGALTNKANFTTAKNTKVFINLIYDGNADMYGAGGLTQAGIEAYKDYSNARSGSQSHQVKATVNGGNLRPVITVAEFENYYISTWMKTRSTDFRGKFSIYDNTNGAYIVDPAYDNPTTWKFSDVTIETPESCVEVHIFGFVETINDIVNYDQMVCIQIPNGNPGFEDVGTTLITNGTMEADANWANYGAPSVNIQSSAQAKSGTYSRKFTSTSTSDGIQSDTFTVTGAQPYIFKYSVYPDDTTNIRHAIRNGANNAWSDDQQYNTINQDAWNDIIDVYVENVGTGGSNAYIALHSNTETSGDWYIDEVYLRAFPSTDWKVTSGSATPTIDVDSSNERSGTYAMKLTNSADADASVYFTKATTTGEYYTIKFYAKATSGDTLTAKIYDLGAELVTNGTFTGDASGWTGVSGNWAYASNDVDGTAATADFYQSMDTGIECFTLFDITAYTSGGLRLLLGAGSGTIRSAVGRYGEVITQSGIANLYVHPTTAFTGTVDNISMKEVKDSWTKTCTATSYTEYSLTFKAQGTSVLVQFYNSASGDITWIDDFSLTPLRKFDPSTNSSAQSYLQLADQTTMATHTFNIGLTGRGRAQGSYANIKFKITLDSI